MNKGKKKKKETIKKKKKIMKCKERIHLGKKRINKKQKILKLSFFFFKLAVLKSSKSTTL